MRIDTLLAAAIFSLTLLLVLARPRELAEAWWAAAGGLLVLVLGLVTPRQAWRIIRLAEDALVFLIGMMILSALAERAGFFEWAATLAARAGGGRVLRLYVFVFLVGTVITATLSLDATAIVLTPIIYGMVVRLRLRPLAFMFAISAIANTASLFLPISNLTNLLLYGALNLDFFRFALVMLLPALLAVLTNIVVFVLLFRRDLRGGYQPEPGGFTPKDRAFFRLATVWLGVVLAGVFAASAAELPVGPVALGGGLLLLAVSWARGWAPAGPVLRAVSWQLIVLVLGLFLVVQGVENAGLAGLIQRAFDAAAPGDRLWQIAATALGTTLGANLITNIPMTIVTPSAVGPLTREGMLRPASAYAALLGTNIG
ncbi:MAG TPA: ArsB/NhaD family transporter, partial [Thermomicrobiaceae bacterium]|nr:ArsB/NhaD family transporter [Thermomicrobiaceae bacterium]